MRQIKKKQKKQQYSFYSAGKNQMKLIFCFEHAIDK